MPLSEMFNYVSTLRGMTKGRAQYTMQLEKYEVRYWRYGTGGVVLALEAVWVCCPLGPQLSPLPRKRPSPAQSGSRRSASLRSSGACASIRGSRCWAWQGFTQLNIAQSAVLDLPQPGLGSPPGWLQVVPSHIQEKIVSDAKVKAEA